MDIAHLIATRPTQRRHLATWYSELLDAAEQEGLSVAELADRLGVVKETIYAWRRRSVAAAPIERESKSAPALVRVRVVDHDRPSTSRPSLELRLQGSRRILVPAGFDVDTLVALVATLERC
jgi:transposase-like protein